MELVSNGGTKIDLEKEKWVSFCVQSKDLAISVSNVKEMISVPKVVMLPNAPKYIRGLMNLRGQIYPVLDMRSLLDLPSQAEELSELATSFEDTICEIELYIRKIEYMLSKHEKINSPAEFQSKLNKVSSSITTQQLILRKELKRFNSYASDFFKIYDSIYVQSKEDLVDQAIESTKSSLLPKFSELKRQYEVVSETLKQDDRQIVLIVELNGEVLSISVDRVISVEQYTEVDSSSLDQSQEHFKNRLFTGIARRRKDQSLVLLMDLAKIYELNMKVAS